EVVPDMAKSVEEKNNGTEYIVTLRKGLKWSDDKPITADDVVFTWNVIVAQGFGNTSTRDNTLIDGKMPIVKKIDDYTVKFILSKPFAPFLRQLSLSIAPKHILKLVTDKGKKEFDSFWGVTTPPKEFVTSGRFKLLKYVPAQRVTFVRNSNYYAVDKKGQKLPYLDNYVVYIVGDLNNELLKFEAGEIDILGIRGNNIARMKEKEATSDFQLYNLGPDTGTTFLVFNLNTRKNENNEYYVNHIKQRWFNDLNFRTAVDYVIDRENLVFNILNGAGSPLFTAESLPSIFLNEKLKDGHPRDFEKAKELLKKSGFYLKNGQLYDKFDNKVEFNLYTNAGNTEREATGVMVKQDLEELGIQVNFKPIEFNVLVGKIVNTYDWDMVMLGLTGSALEPHSGRNVWASNGALHMFNQRDPSKPVTDAFLWEKRLDEIFEKGASETDFEKRKEIYNEYQEIVYKQKPFVYLYSPLRIQSVRTKFGNIKPTPLGGTLHNLEEIYIKSEEKN
ncbi:MAG: ABC transporter substrate-binding protein, partial [Candidatus Gastranaerophilales bacterium]|nr:ABC transporter substrate-binding protein [Candidatus Gastranaerophilales bacterium]